MSAVAERLRHRSPAAAERNGRALGAKLVALGVEQQDRTLHQVRPVVENGNLRLFSHGCLSRPLVTCPGLLFALPARERCGYRPPLHIPDRLSKPYSFRANLVSRPMLVAAATTCIKANVPADDPVPPAKAMGMNERSRPTAAMLQKTKIDRRVNRLTAANTTAAPIAPAALAPMTWPIVTASSGGLTTGPKRDDAIASTSALTLADKAAASVPARKRRTAGRRSEVTVLGAVCSIR